MDDSGSITNWLGLLKQGDELAAQKIWERYVRQLVTVARHKLAASSRRAADEEDVVAIAFHNFWKGVQEGRFPRLDDRHDLWQVLLMLTDRRATDAIRGVTARRKHEQGESALGGQPFVVDIKQLAAQEPTPDFAAEMVESVEAVLAAIDDDGLRRVALWKLEGYKNSEIAEKLACVERTVERKLRMIRERVSGLA